MGDLIEECPQRSRAWFWRQVLFAVLTRAITGASAGLRGPQRLEGALTSFAMFIVLSSSFHQLHFKPPRQWCSCSGCWSGVRALLSTIDKPLHEFGER
jgi:hypothetical protein